MATDPGNFGLNCSVCKFLRSRDSLPDLTDCYGAHPEGKYKRWDDEVVVESPFRLADSPRSKALGGDCNLQNNKSNADCDYTSADILFRVTWRECRSWGRHHRDLLHVDCSVHVSMATVVDKNKSEKQGVQMQAL